MASLGAWFRAAGLASVVWIPAFAGMTGGRKREWRGLLKISHSVITFYEKFVKIHCSASAGGGL